MFCNLINSLSALLFIPLVPYIPNMCFQYVLSWPTHALMSPIGISLSLEGIVCKREPRSEKNCSIDASLLVICTDNCCIPILANWNLKFHKSFNNPNWDTRKLLLKYLTWWPIQHCEPSADLNHCPSKRNYIHWSFHVGISHQLDRFHSVLKYQCCSTEAH